MCTSNLRSAQCRHGHTWLPVSRSGHQGVVSTQKPKFYVQLKFKMILLKKTNSLLGGSMIRFSSIIILFLGMLDVADAQPFQQKFAALTVHDQKLPNFTSKDRNRSFAQNTCRDTRPPGGSAPLCAGRCEGGNLCDIDGNGCSCQ